MALIDVRNVVKVYGEESPGRVEALKGITLTLESGTFACLAGPSGSGKTTLLNLIGALDRPTSGAIWYEGRQITALPMRQLTEFRLRQVGFVFQAYNLIPTLTAIENAEYVLLLQGIDLIRARRQASHLLERVGLSGMLHRRVSELSGGQQQRVAVARAIVAQPKVVLADEPTANLDSTTAAQLIDLVRELNREQGVSFLFSTHDPMVMERCDRVFRMRDGRILV